MKYEQSAESTRYGSEKLTVVITQKERDTGQFQFCRKARWKLQLAYIKDYAPSVFRKAAKCDRPKAVLFI